MIERFEAFSEYIVELNRCLQKIKEAEMSKFGLHAKHTMCLYYLGKCPEGLTPTELTHMCSEDKAAVSRSLSQLEDGGLVSRAMPNDKRAYRVVYKLTEDGRHTVEKINDRVDAALFSGGNGLTDEERESFYRSLKLILDNLKNYLKDSEDTKSKEEALQ